MERIDKLGIIFLAIMVFLAFVTFILYPLIPLFFGLEGREPPYCQYGDVDGNGIVDKMDFYAPVLTWDAKERADVDNDGDVDSYDKTLIYWYAEGYDIEFPIANASSPSYQYDENPPSEWELWGDDEGIVGETFTFYAMANESNGEILTVYLRLYDLNGNPIREFPEHDILPGTTISEQYVFNAPGTYKLYLYVTYRYRTFPWVEKGPMIIRVHQRGYGSPIADFIYSMDGLKVTFIDKSYDPNGYITNWTWYFGDGTVGYGNIVIHEYGNYGKYNVTLTVKDNDGNVASKTITIEIKRSVNWWWIAGGIGFISVVGILYMRRRKK